LNYVRDLLLQQILQHPLPDTYCLSNANRITQI